MLAWNPIAPIVDFAQTIFLEDRVPALVQLAYPTLQPAVTLFARLGSSFRAS